MDLTHQELTMSKYYYRETNVPVSFLTASFVPTFFRNSVIFLSFLMVILEYYNLRLVFRLDTLLTHPIDYARTVIMVIYCVLLFRIFVFYLGFRY
jgi:uncharacterized membrane protein YesL